MTEEKIVSKIRNYWLGLPIGSKMKAFILLLLLVVFIASGFNVYTIQFSVVDVNNILREISQCENAQDAMTSEAAASPFFLMITRRSARSALPGHGGSRTPTVTILPKEPSSARVYPTAPGPIPIKRMWTFSIRSMICRIISAATCKAFHSLL